MNITNVRFQNTREQRPLDESSPSLVRDPNKCILCGDCVRACEEIQGIGALGFAFRGTDAMVMPAFNKKIAGNQLCQLRPVPGVLSHRRHLHQDSYGAGMGCPDRS